MTKEDFLKLAENYYQGTCTQDESDVFEAYFQKLDAKSSPLTSWSLSKQEKVRLRMLQKINEQIDSQSTNVRSLSVHKRFWYAAASVVLLFVVSIGLYTAQDEPTAINYVTRVTQAGQKATITLNDGSTIRLNSESSVTYPEVFTPDKRAVSLKGEAFFDVRKEEARPFIVTTRDIQTTVLGTSFNINAYNSESVSVALVSGKVKVQKIGPGSNTSQMKVDLRPNELAFYESSIGDIEVVPFDLKEQTAWKDGIIYLSDANYQEVFDRLAKWYNVKIAFENKPTIKWVYSGEFKNMSLELVLKTIGYSGGFGYHIKGDTVHIHFKK